MADSVPVMCVDSEVDYVTTTQWRPRRWMVVGMVTAVAGVAGVVYSGTRARVNPVHMHVARGHDIMRAYVGRVLADEHNLERKFHYTWNAAGAAAPAAMVIEAKLVKSDDATSDAKFTFKAKDGKAYDLKTQLEDILQEKKKLMTEQFGEDAGKMFSDLMKVEDPDDDEVTVKLIDPAPVDFSDMEEDMKKAPPPTFQGKISFGRGLQEMVLEGQDDSVFTVSKGFEMEGSRSLVRAAFTDLEGDLHLGPEVAGTLEMLKDMTSDTVDMDLRYAPDAQFEGYPKMKDTMRMISHLASELPDELVQKYRGLDQVVDGLTSITIGGLPGKFELDMDLTNFHVGPWIKAILDNMPKKEGPFSMMG